MAFKEIILERASAALEATRGTAIAAPTHVFNFAGLLTPAQEHYEPAESRSQKWTRFRSQVTRQGAVFSLADHPIDVNLVTFWLNMLVKPVTSPTQPDAVNWPNTYLWTFTPTAASDDVKAATVWWGEALVQYWKSDFAMLTQGVFNNDANRVEGAMHAFDGLAGFPSQVAAPSLPANIGGDLLSNGIRAQQWLDTSSAIGTTLLTATSKRYISSRHTLTDGVFPKYLGGGPTAALDYSDVGIDVAGVQLASEITLEVPDTNEYDIWEAGTVVKLRDRYNGPVIDVYGGGSNSYRYIEFDNYGVLKNPRWGQNRGNRTVTFTIESTYDATLAAPFSVKVQNSRSSL